MFSHFAEGYASATSLSGLHCDVKTDQIKAGDALLLIISSMRLLIQQKGLKHVLYIPLQSSTTFSVLSFRQVSQE